MKPVRVEPEAKEELAAAVAWYESRREGLGREFIVEIDVVFAAIARTPARFPLYPRVSVKLGVRRAIAGRFPYAIAFMDTGSVIRVVAIAHQRRRPGYWQGRLAAP
jgi:plasmid stabilization system protein ParE